MVCQTEGAELKAFKIVVREIPLVSNATARIMLREELLGRLSRVECYARQLLVATAGPGWYY
jgi:hypothetical protein